MRRTVLHVNCTTWREGKTIAGIWLIILMLCFTASQWESAPFFLSAYLGILWHSSDFNSWMDSWTMPLNLLKYYNYSQEALRPDRCDYSNWLFEWHLDCTYESSQADTHPKRLSERIIRCEEMCLIFRLPWKQNMAEKYYPPFISV